MQTIAVDLPESVFPALKKSPSEFVKETRLAAAVKWYELGTVSQDRAAEIAGLSRAEFLDALGRFRVSPFQYTQDELRTELNNVD